MYPSASIDYDRFISPPGYYSAGLFVAPAAGTVFATTGALEGGLYRVMFCIGTTEGTGSQTAVLEQRSGGALVRSFEYGTTIYSSMRSAEFYWTVPAGDTVQLVKGPAAASASTRWQGFILIQKVTTAV